MNPTPITEIPEFDLALNRARYKNELAEAAYRLMIRQRVSRKRLGELLGLSKGRVSQILSGDSNFRAENVADLFMVLGRAVHPTLGTNAEEVRIFMDEAATRLPQGATEESEYGKEETYKITDYQDITIFDQTRWAEPRATSATGEGETVWHPTRNLAGVVRSCEDFTAQG